MIENVIEMNILLDFYGKLLSEKQLRAMEMYYVYDYSLNEIAAELHISKQAVSDNLKRAEFNLKEFDEKLNLIESDKKNKAIFNELKENLSELERNSENLDLKALEKIKAIIDEEVY